MLIVPIRGMELKDQSSSKKYAAWTMQAEGGAMELTMPELIIIAGGFLYFITATLYLVEKNKTFAHFIIAAFLFSTSIWQIYHGLAIMGVMHNYPHLSLIHFPFYFFSIPLLFFFFRILTEDDFTFKPGLLIHFMPGIAAFIILIPFYMQTSEVKRMLFTNTMQARDRIPSQLPQPHVLLVLVVISMVSYAAYFAVRSVPFLIRKRHAMHRITVFSLSIIASFYMAIISYVAIFILVRFFSVDPAYFKYMIRIISVLLSIQIYIILIVKTRHPDYIIRIQAEAKKIRYATSRITGLDIDGIITRLNELMVTEKIFCDEDLTLAGLAEELSITPYQLSQILNERLNKNFNTYINEFRIREAEKILIDEPERSITSISYAVGFNTPATFYKAFGKIFSISPIKYREECRVTAKNQK